MSEKNPHNAFKKFPKLRQQIIENAYEPSDYAIQYVDSDSKTASIRLSVVLALLDKTVEKRQKQIEEAKRELAKENNSPFYNAWLKGYIEAKEEDLKALK